MKIECDNNQIVATLLAALVMDRAGRRLLLNTSALLMVSKISIIDLIMSICPHLKIVHDRLNDLIAVFAQVISIGLLGFNISPINSLLEAKPMNIDMNQLA